MSEVSRSMSDEDIPSSLRYYCQPSEDIEVDFFKEDVIIDSTYSPIYQNNIDFTSTQPDDKFPKNQNAGCFFPQPNNLFEQSFSTLEKPAIENDLLRLDQTNLALNYPQKRSLPENRDIPANNSVSLNKITEISLEYYPDTIENHEDIEKNYDVEPTLNKKIPEVRDFEESKTTSNSKTASASKKQSIDTYLNKLFSQRGEKSSASKAPDQEQISALGTKPIESKTKISTVNSLKNAIKQSGPLQAAFEPKSTFSKRVKKSPNELVPSRSILSPPKVSSSFFKEISQSINPASNKPKNWSQNITHLDRILDASKKAVETGPRRQISKFWSPTRNPRALKPSQNRDTSPISAKKLFKSFDGASERIMSANIKSMKKKTNLANLTKTNLTNASSNKSDYEKKSLRATKNQSNNNMNTSPVVSFLPSEDPSPKNKEGKNLAQTLRELRLKHGPSNKKYKKAEIGSNFGDFCKQSVNQYIVGQKMAASSGHTPKYLNTQHKSGKSRKKALSSKSSIQSVDFKLSNAQMKPSGESLFNWRSKPIPLVKNGSHHKPNKLGPKSQASLQHQEGGLLQKIQQIMSPEEFNQIKNSLTSKSRGTDKRIPFLATGDIAAKTNDISEASGIGGQNNMTNCWKLLESLPDTRSSKKISLE